MHLGIRRCGEPTRQHQSSSSSDRLCRMAGGDGARRPAGVPVDDAGGETARRYRYQWTYAAIICCMLLDDEEGVAEVFCEHHEDILIKYNSGTLAGLQIKTRAPNQQTWRANDEGIRKALSRFTSLEARFPGQFQQFRFLTNHPLHSARNGRDLIFVLNCIRSSPRSSLPTSVAQVVTRTAKDAKCTEDVAFAALAKTFASDDLPKFRDIEVRLTQSLIELWPTARECPYNSVRQAALNLQIECQRASSLSHEDVAPAYLAASLDPDATDLAARVGNKRLDRKRVMRVLQRGLDDVAAPLTDGSSIAPGSGSPVLLPTKLDAGGFSAVSLNAAADLRDKADYLGLQWIKKLGRSEGLNRYRHVRSIVLSDAARAYERTKTANGKFGFEMLEDFRSQLANRRANDTQFYDCTNEHIEGFAYVLTSECLVTWSADRPWEVK